MSYKCVSYKCKVCYDAGKPAAVYNSHYVKSADRSTVTCPTILSIKCRYCGETGHTLKYCVKLAEKEKASKKVAFTTNNTTTKPPVKSDVKVAIKNMFSMLDDDDDEKEEGEIVDEEEEQEEEEEEEEKSYVDAVNTIPSPPKLVRQEVKRWADYSDSEAEEDDE
jgi:Ran GTPase-activating protein (RanGAP) involved in mRNA processing and transport